MHLIGRGKIDGLRTIKNQSINNIGPFQGAVGIVVLVAALVGIGLAIAVLWHPQPSEEATTLK